MVDPTPEESEVLKKIGTPPDRASCFVRAWGLDLPHYMVAFQGLERALEREFENAEGRGRSSAFAEIMEKLEKQRQELLALQDQIAADRRAAVEAEARESERQRNEAHSVIKELLEFVQHSTACLVTQNTPCDCGLSEMILNARYRIENAPGRESKANPIPAALPPKTWWVSSHEEGAYSGPFDTREEAVAYAQKHGIPYRIELPKEAARRQISYAENFRYDRKTPWTH